MDDEGPSTSYRRSFPEGRNGPLFQESSDDAMFESRTTEEELRDHETDGLYAILNLPKSASEADIKERYRSLAVMFHPDRNQDPSMKESAERHFRNIQRAYEVLMDPQKRAVYDLLGEEGLRTNWEVGHRIKTPEEMRRHYQRQVNEKRQASIESLVKSKGDISCVLDARAVFLPESFFINKNLVNGISHSPLARLNRVRVGQIMMKHSFETPLTKDTQIVWQGQMLANNGRGGGNVVGTIRHQFSPKIWLEAGSSILNPRIQTGKLIYTFDQDTFANANVVSQTLKAPPGVSLTFGKRLFGTTTGFATAKSGFWELGPWGRGLASTLGRHDRPALTFGLTSQGPQGTGWTVSTTGGVIDKQFSADYTLKVLDGLKLKVGTSIGVGEGGALGLEGFVNAERQVTETLKAGVGLTAALPGGLTLKIRFMRLGQKVVIPIMLSQDLNPTVMFFSAVLPATSFVALHYLYLQPRKRRQIRDKVKDLQEEHAEYLAQKKAEALDAVALMEEQVQRRLVQERANDGLIIVSAYYGLANCFTAIGMREVAGAEDKVVDVTLPLQALVTNGLLAIPGGRAKFNLLGFFDCAMGEPKVLRVRYLFKSKMHEVTVDDVSALRAPLRAHAVEDSRDGTWEL